MGGAAQALGRKLGTQALVEAQRRLAPQPKPRRGPSDIHVVEVRRFQEQGLRVLGDLCVCPTHHPRQPNWSVGIGDYKHLGVQGPVFAVQGQQPLPGSRPSHDDPVVLDLVVIEGVKGLPVLHHHVIRDVNHVVDGPHPACLQPFLHPRRRRPDLQFRHDARRIPAAQVRVGNLHRRHLPRRPLLLSIGNLRRCHPSTGKGRHLLCHPEHRQAVGAVRRQLQFQYAVSKIFQQRHSRRRILRQYENSLVLLGHPKLLLGADHAVGDHAPDLRRFQLHRFPRMAVEQLRPDSRKSDVLARGHVGSSADHLMGLAGCVDDTQAQAVGVRVLVHLPHSPDTHPLPLLSNLFHLPHLDTRHSQLMGQFLRLQGHGHILPEPLERYFHWLRLNPDQHERHPRYSAPLSDQIV